MRSRIDGTWLNSSGAVDIVSESVPKGHLRANHTFLGLLESCDDTSISLKNTLPQLRHIIHDIVVKLERATRQSTATTQVQHNSPGSAQPAQPV